MQVRNTTQRKLILDLMNENYTHPTADEIYEAARKEDGHISRGTVYRNLNFLVESGAIQKIVVPEGADHYDFNLSEHYHFYCQQCGKMYDVPGSATVVMESAAREMELQGFLVKGHNLILSGLCPECRN